MTENGNNGSWIDEGYTDEWFENLVNPNDVASERIGYIDGEEVWI